VRGGTVVEGLRTLEVRWIRPGRLDAKVTGWFGRFPAEVIALEDAYLVDPDLRGLSAKIRAGRALEVKVYHGRAGVLDVPGRARGRVQSWQKWSFPVGPLSVDGVPPGWTVVSKNRRISRFRLDRGRVVLGAADPAGEPGCMAELTEVLVRGETWWSLGFEATGPVGLIRSALEGTAALMFELALPGAELGLGDCRSYPEWLSRISDPE
jgi:hypothetical protein